MSAAKKLRIALLAPFYYRLTERSDGGIETFLTGLAASLTARGHQVTTFGIGDSKIAGQLIAIYDEPTAEFTTDPYIRQSREIAGSVITFNRLAETSGEYDVIHNNQINFYAHLQAHRLPNCLTTLHSPPDYYPILQAKQVDAGALSERVVAISDYQRQNSQHGYIGRVYNGINLNEYQFVAEPDNKQASALSWLGRLIPDKGIEDALAAAEQSASGLRFAGIHWDQAFSDKILARIADNHQITYLGHADLALKNQLLGQSLAFIFPTHFNEFGYVRTEALACGTPVITYDNGAAREIVEDGVTGFICPPGDVAALAVAVNRIKNMPAADYRVMRQRCRQRAEQLFSIETMAASYETIYREIAR